MCSVCDSRRASRRHFLSMTAAGVLGAAAGPALAKPPVTRVTPDEALARLKAGNERYVRASQLCEAQLPEQRGKFTRHQEPWATVVSCADSRVPPELVFDAVGISELFVVRNAGNLVSSPVDLGTVEYGAAVLGIPLIVILGHSRCGAVAAACEIVEKGTEFPGWINQLAQTIMPAALAARPKPGDFVQNTVRESAQRSARRLSTDSPAIGKLIEQGKTRVVPAVYDLETGRVDFLS
jgi:carbonic anhydrase